MHEKQRGGIFIENMSMPQKGKVRVLVLRDDGRCIDEFGNVYKVVPVNREDRQPMYEELIKELRKESCGAKTTSWWRAADAIEELQATLCNWCAVCQEDKRDLSTCEIYESCRAKPPKEETE